MQQAGVHMFLEKPLSRSADEAQRLVAGLRGRSVQNAVGYMNRYRDTVRQAKEFAREHMPLGFVAYWTCSPYKVPWWPQRDRSGGAFNEQGTHVVDLARYIMGDVAEVVGVSNEPDSESGCAISMRFESGCLGTLLYSCAASEKSIGMRLIGARSTFSLWGWDFLPDGHSPLPTSSRYDVFNIETAAFLHAVLSNDATLIKCNAAEACETQRVVDAMILSMKTGCGVRVSS
jgi:myo-inositol 2-dehydrogenase / D-chiro-inositol 1-dehydrogenase